MAIRYAVATGNWSAVGTWDGGVALPGAADDVHANTYTVTIDQDITVVSINTTAGGAAAAGGGFSASAARTITANVLAGSTTCLTLTHTSGTTTVTGTVTGSATAAVNGINCSGTGGFLTVVGNVTPGAGAGPGINFTSASGTLSVTGTLTGAGSQIAVQTNAATQTVVIVGAVLGGGGYGFYSNALLTSFTQSGGAVTGGSSQSAITLNGGTAAGSITATVTGGTGGSATGITLAGACTLTITGDITAGTLGAGLSAGHVSGTVTVVGNILAAGANGANHTSTGVMTITGNVTGGSAGMGMNDTGTGNVTITGDVTTGTVGYGIQTNVAGGTLTVNGNVSAAPATSASCGIYVLSSRNLTVNGNATGGTSTAVGSAGVIGNSTGTVTITGTALGGGGATSYGVDINAIGTYRVGIAKSNVYPNGGEIRGVAGVNISADTQSCTIDAMEFGSGGVSPISKLGKFYIRAAGTNFVKMRESSGGAVVEMGEVGADYPTIANVRLGTVYNSGGLTGTCAVPGAGSVAFGVAIDATTGTAVLTGALVWSEVLEGAYTAKGIMRLLAAYAAGTAANMSSTATFTGLDGVTTRISGTIVGPDRTITGLNQA